jgi:hypothetical protein
MNVLGCLLEGHSHNRRTRLLRIVCLAVTAALVLLSPIEAAAEEQDQHREEDAAHLWSEFEKIEAATKEYQAEALKDRTAAQEYRLEAQEAERDGRHSRAEVASKYQRFYEKQAESAEDRAEKLGARADGQWKRISKSDTLNLAARNLRKGSAARNIRRARRAQLYANHEGYLRYMQAAERAKSDYLKLWKQARRNQGRPIHTGPRGKKPSSPKRAH